MSCIRLVSIGALALSLTACKTLDRLESNQCGNGVVDTAEDCDGFPRTEHLEGNESAELRCGALDESDARKRCRYVCDPMMPNSTCPLGWSCGKDGICLYPVGEYQVEPPSDVQFNDWAVVDVNGDSHVDIIGYGETSITIKTGTATGEFSGSQVTPTPPRASPPSITLLDDDLTQDFVLAIQDGLFVMQTSTKGVLSPVPYAVIDPETQYPMSQYPGGVIPIVTEMNSTALYTPYDHFLVLLDTGTQLQLTYVPATLGAANPFATLPAYQPLSKLVRPVAVANLDVAPGRMEEEVALAFKDTNKISIYGQNLAVMVHALELRSEVTLASGTVEEGAQFADVDGDGALDLLISTTGDRVAVATGLGNGSFNAPAQDDVFDDLLTLADPFGQLDDIDTNFVRWPLATGDFDGDGKADYVTPQGVYVTSPGSGLRQSAWRIAEDPWSRAIVDDFNGDGHLDVVTHFDPDEGEARIEYLLGDGSGSFATHVIPVGGVPVYLDSGDFDGDLVPDLAIATRDSRDQDEDQLFVLFGSRDGVASTPVSMGKFGFIEEMRAGAFWSPLQPIPDRSDDLLVFLNLDSDFAGQRRLALLNGSPSRQLAAPFTLISAELGGAFSPEFAIAGRFTGQTNAGDVLVFATDDAAADSVWLVQGLADAQLAAPVKLPLGGSFGDDTCSAEDALWVKGDFDSDGATDLIGLSNASECDTSGFGMSRQPELFQISMDSGPTVTSTGPIGLPGGFLVPYHAVVRDVDDDGQPDLVVSFSGEYQTEFDSLPTGAGVVVYWNQAGVITIDGASAVPIPGTVSSVIAAAPLQADDDAALEVAVFTDEGVMICHMDGRAFVDPCDQHAAGEGFFRSELGGERLFVADVNGDGLDDVIIGDGTQIFIATAQSQLSAQGQGGAR